MALPTSLYRADQVRELDRLAITGQGIIGITLMERAGHSAWEILRSYWPHARQIAVVCGAGNNGGDGYVLARLALESEFKVCLVAIGDPKGLKGDARIAYESFCEHPNAVVSNYAADMLDGMDVIVDALLGIGLDREVSGDYRKVIEDINRAGNPVLAMDIPSGLNANTGTVMGTAVRASATITFLGLKQGMFTGQGSTCCGRIYFSDLDVPRQLYQEITPAVVRMDYATQSRLLTPRDRHAHKGDNGHVLVVGGDYGYAGAVRMAAEAAARSGAGLVSLATRPEHAAAIPLAVPELMARGIDKAIDLKPLLDRATVVAVGPGLGQSEWGSRMLTLVLDSKLPLIVDADALNLLARDPVYSDKWILTPHPGEAARMLQSSTGTVSADRFAAVRMLQEKFGGTIVLKGSGTLVADGSAIHLCSGGNPGMASGGMGDVLTGIIAGLAAQGIALNDAARLGVCLHAAAADAAATNGERGLLATDLMPCLHKLVNPGIV